MSTAFRHNSASDHNAAEKRRNLIRFGAAALAGATAIIYFLIGLHVVSVLDGNADQIFGLFAGAGYTLGVILLLATDRRVLWVLGALLQIFVIFTYFNLAPQRSPAYEVWGITLRVVQVALLAALAYLALRLPQEQPKPMARHA